ncbi:hypothetical protein [Cesiribacter andamanensis]|uniref:hypothetical protein n=1 Tax=Cesiribacter andamanensis TaxID=649507 RepID=UPI00034DE5D5|nr:hypothetical protein [Cesiribacter andamanensis]
MIVFVLPNTINFRERDAFSQDKRLEWAAQYYHISSVPDSVLIPPGEWYDRGGAHPLFFGEKYRDLWGTPVKVRVLKYDEIKGGLTPKQIGGGQQTFSVDFLDGQEREWAVRSVNKDQSKALPKVLRWTVFRFMFRDQAASMNPYGSLILPPMAEAINIYHTNPVLVFVPFDESKKEFNDVLAGRMALLENDADGSWEKDAFFDNASEIDDTEEMLERAREKGIPLDTLMYARSRLFDLLISDWDRHEGQWKWALVEEGGQKIYRPIPGDRDMALYRFNEGLFPKITLLLNPKFQSFRKDYGRVKGLTRQAADMDRQFLASISLTQMVALAEEIKAALTDEVIEEAFQRYPAEIREKVGREHAEIMRIRRDKLPEVAREFWEITQKNIKKNR